MDTPSLLSARYGQVWRKPDQAASGTLPGAVREGQPEGEKHS